MRPPTRSKGAPGQWPRQDDRDRGRDQSDRGGLGAHSHHEQEVEGHQEAEAELDHAGEELAEVGREEIQMARQPELEQRRLHSELNDHERHQEQHRRRERDHRGRRAPAVRLPLAQAEHERGDAEPEGDRPGIVEFRPAPFAGPEIRRCGQRQQDRYERKWNVDPEDKSPVD
jgi:hypothetical protein